jgi:uncharacterized protein (TIGR01244 family)
MTNSRKILSLAAFVLLNMAAALQAQAPEKSQEKPKPPLPNYVELSARIGTGGQPDQTGIKQLVEKGYKTIINIRTLSEEADLAGEEKLALQLGLRYYMVPFGGQEPQEEQALAFNTLLSALKEEKVFIHCGSGNRVGSLLMIYFTLEEGMPMDKAEQEAKKAGLRNPQLLEFSKQVIGRRKK